MPLQSLHTSQRSFKRFVPFDFLPEIEEVRVGLPVSGEKVDTRVPNVGIEFPRRRRTPTLLATVATGGRDADRVDSSGITLHCAGDIDGPRRARAVSVVSNRRR